MSPWTDDIDAYVKTALASGKSFLEVSAGIKAQFGVTISRSAVIGRAARLGAKSLHAPHKTAHVKLKPKLKPLPRRPAPQPQATGTGKPVPLMKLKGYHCRSVLDGLKDNHGHPLYCGNRVRKGSVWCAAHYRVYVAGAQQGGGT